MPSIKVIHLGGIINVSGHVETFVGESRSDVLKQMNAWFFDFFHDQGLQTRQLPAYLDDWTGSKGDASFYSVKFPNSGSTVWTKTDSIHFSG